MLEYKGYKISGSSIPMYMEGCESLGSVCKPDRNGSVIEVACIEAKIFKTMKEGETHGLDWRESGWIENGWGYNSRFFSSSRRARSQSKDVHASRLAHPARST